MVPNMVGRSTDYLVGGVQKARATCNLRRLGFVQVPPSTNHRTHDVRLFSEQIYISSLG